jgi:hypothetical protein
MKINRLINFLFVGVILSGLVAGAFILGGERRAVPERMDQNLPQTNDNDSYVAASISEGTILLLLAVGVIGVLGISRKKKDLDSTTQRNGTSIGAENQKFDTNRQKL